MSISFRSPLRHGKRVAMELCAADVLGSDVTYAATERAPAAGVVGVLPAITVRSDSRQWFDGLDISPRRFNATPIDALCGWYGSFPRTILLQMDLTGAGASQFAFDSTGNAFGGGLLVNYRGSSNNDIIVQLRDSVGTLATQTLTGVAAGVRVLAVVLRVGSSPRLTSYVDGVQAGQTNLARNPAAGNQPRVTSVLSRFDGASDYQGWIRLVRLLREELSSADVVTQTNILASEGTDRQTVAVWTVGDSMVSRNDSWRSGCYEAATRGMRVIMRNRGAATGGNNLPTANNFNGGLSGNRIDQYIAAFTAQLPEGVTPNQKGIGLIMIGTNDAVQNYEWSTVILRLAQLCAMVGSAGYEPYVCTLPPNLSDDTNTRIQQFNRQLRTAEQVPCKVVDVGPVCMRTATDLPDGTHPSTTVFLEMGKQVAQNMGWARKPHRFSPYGTFRHFWDAQQFNASQQTWTDEIGRADMATTGTALALGTMGLGQGIVFAGASRLQVNEVTTSITKLHNPGTTGATAVVIARQDAGAAALPHLCATNRSDIVQGMRFYIDTAGPSVRAKVSDETGLIADVTAGGFVLQGGIIVYVYRITPVEADIHVSSDFADASDALSGPPSELPAQGFFTVGADIIGSAATLFTGLVGAVGIAAHAMTENEIRSMLIWAIGRWGSQERSR